ncbi:MAG: hypothetical protein IPG64_16495 [Haliea sp.]|nr:hypothetical protein [Haliea sp.]
MCRDHAAQIDLPRRDADYRLAPSSNPAAADDCLNAYWIGRSGTEPCDHRTAGGILLAAASPWACCSDCKDEGLPLPAAFVSMAGGSIVGVGFRQCRVGTLPDARMGATVAAIMLRAQFALDDPRVSPHYADLGTAPLRYLQIGQFRYRARGRIAPRRQRTARGRRGDDGELAAGSGAGTDW